ncbi:hypothetical protein [Pleurocapsa sp. PCC 7319]|uniref:hypothetical protein n=1 Tax=Pleurocapsa sp. PCC 7319 TaxID=118161 RepID=UPI00034B320E|nr:hypothetical protein [Pleurocapsa sp. PCC 7319]
MYEYHGWFTFPDCWHKPETIKHTLHMINDPYPASVNIVNKKPRKCDRTTKTQL